MLKLIALLYLTCAGLTVAGPVPQCPDAQDQSLPLPSSVAPGQLVSFEKNVLAFLQSRTYVSLGWCSDKAIRNTGPYQNGVSYGPHPAVRIYYSPKVMKWLLGGRIGAIPDGGMIIKEQLPPPAERYSSSAPDPSDWTVMIRDSAGSKDGWFWGEWYDGMPFDDDAFPFNYPAAGFGLYCLRCHSSAAKEYTFASLDNIKGFPGSPLKYAVDNSWQAAGPGSSLHGSPPANPGVTLPGPPNPAFLQTFPGFPAPTYEGVQRMPSETYDRVVSGAHGPEQFLTSEQCMNCHSALNGPFGPTMFLQTGPFSTGSYPGYNVSPYGEWRWSPMGLAGRDPVFHSQVESELAFAKTRMSNPGTQIVNLCFSCHGVMGKRQIDIDHRADPDFKLDYVQLTDRADPHFKYGSLARDGISCATCHHIVESQYPPYEPPLKYFLEHSITGQFETGSSEQVFGPFKDQSISTWPMKNALGITPKHNAYVKSARLCGSCHTIRLPVLDSPNPDTFSIEQATYLEWLNSAYQNEFKPMSSASKTCQDCHMPGGIHNKNFDIDQLKERIATIEDNTYPP
ncbi:MAG: cytochrome P460 family protein, partial [Acidobacteriaceae bacterium]|nr:cytochrome P460 family protein [Acidobacteriaceae bacterium]